MEKKFEVSEQKFAQVRAVHYLCNVMHCAKFSFWLKISKNEEK